MSMYNLLTLTKGVVLKINLLKPIGHVVHQQFNLLKPTGYVMHQQFKPFKAYCLRDAPAV